MANTKVYNVIKAIIDYLEKKGVYYTKEKALIKCEPNTITIKDAKTPIGTTVEGMETFSVAGDGKNKTFNVVALPKGTWIFACEASFTPAGSGTYSEKHNALDILIEGSQAVGTRHAFSGNQRVDMSTATVHTITSGTENFGVTLRSYDRDRSVNLRWKAVRIS